MAPCECRPRKDAAEVPVAVSEDDTLSSNSSSSSLAWEEEKQRIVEERERISREHNVPTHTGWRRNTMHFEMNLACALLWYGLYLWVQQHEQQEDTTTSDAVSWYTRLRLGMTIFSALLVIDASRYYYYRGSMPGVPYTPPFVSLVAMVLFPVRFWAELATIAMESGQGICTNFFGGKFMIFVTDTAIARQVMTAEGTFGIYAHPNALWLFGPQNLIYMEQATHKRFRAILTPALFSKEALTQYARAQIRVCRKYLHAIRNECQTTHRPFDARIACRAMAAASSQEAFLGPYLNDAMREHLERDIVTFTMGFLSFPIPYVGGLKKAIQAKERIEHTLRNIATLAREYVTAGNPPRCLMERWALAIQEAQQQGTMPESCPCGDDDMARSVLDFLFAAQDATNSALAHALDVLDDHRQVLAKLRREIDQECGSTAAQKNSDHDQQEDILWNKLSEGMLPYTAKVANQLLHHKPPVPMIPHLAKKSTSIGPNGKFNIPKGAVVIPSITYTARTSGASVDFIPEREGPDADPMFVQCVTFGAGQHKCPGRRYAESLLTVFLAVLAQEYDFARVGTRPKVDEFVYFPTTFANDCDFVLTERKTTTV